MAAQLTATLPGVLQFSDGREVLAIMATRRDVEQFIAQHERIASEVLPAARAGAMHLAGKPDHQIKNFTDRISKQAAAVTYWIPVLRATLALWRDDDAPTVTYGALCARLLAQSRGLANVDGAARPVAE
jgi:hypothetical protein